MVLLENAGPHQIICQYSENDIYDSVLETDVVPDPTIEVQKIFDRPPRMHSIIETSSTGTSRMKKVSWEDLLHFVTDTISHDHIIFFYDDQESKHQVLFSYFKAGLEKGDGGIYVAFEETEEELREAMNKFGINTAQKENGGRLRIFNYNPWYMDQGEININTIVLSWRRIYKESQTDGKKGLRVAGDVSCFFKYNRVKELLQYERRLCRKLKLPIEAICAYSTKEVSPDLSIKLIKAHRYAIF